MDDNAALKVAELIAQGLDKRIDTLEETLVGRMDRLDDRMDRFETGLEAVRVQTTKTNGRVTKLETERDSKERDRSIRIDSKRYRLTTLIAFCAFIGEIAHTVL